MNILSAFDTFFNEVKRNRSGVDWTAKLQTKENLASKGLPSRKEESWRNTSLKFLNDLNFVPATQAPQNLSSKITDIVQANQISGTDLVVLVNGFYVPSLSTVEKDSISVNPVSASPITFRGDAGSVIIHDLNEVYNLDSLEVKVVKSPSKPLHIMSIACELDAMSVVLSPRLRVTMAVNTEVKIALSHLGEKDATYFSNGHFTFSLEKDARLELVNNVNQSVNSYHFDFVGISAQAASTIRYFELNLNGQLTRHELVLELNGENIQSEVLGASYLRGKQHCDSQTFINHHRGGNQSKQVYKAVLDDEARSVFSGTVFIAEGIAKTDSAQLNQNLLLSDRAEVNSKPVLRIFSDDVKASHGSTIGQVSEDEIFYLQSRCISRSKAIDLLGQGFLNEIVFRIGSEIFRTYFREMVLREFQESKKPKLKVVN